mmetsp:Transcript_43283/g.99768  ORF Transcript_43283/g.99768 Transcript_43283/m.99768 type:complete len:333 (-) Transcript_43283:31-1029(-)
MLPMQATSPFRSPGHTGRSPEGSPPTTNGDGAAEVGPSAPIGKLSRMALMDAVCEVEAKARATWTKSTVAVHKMRQSIDQSLGMEVAIKDPALKKLFQENVLGAEELLKKLSAQAYAFLAAIDALCNNSLSSTSGTLRPLAETMPKGQESQQELLMGIWQELEDVGAHVTTHRTHFISQVHERVIAVIAQRMSAHAKVREDLRERDRWTSVLERSRKDLAKLHKAANKGGSGLRSMLNVTQTEESEELLRDAMHHVARLDEDLLTSLCLLGENMLESIRTPWAALLQLEAEFYASQQGAWMSLEQVFKEAVALADKMPAKTEVSQSVNPLSP